MPFMTITVKRGKISLCDIKEDFSLSLSIAATIRTSFHVITGYTYTPYINK